MNTTTQAIADSLTGDQARAYLSHPSGPSWLSVADVMANPGLRLQAARRIYAGNNPMGHHAKTASSAYDVFDGLASPEKAKARAGSCLVSARWNRTAGKRREVAEALSQAAYWRRFADEVHRKKRARYPFVMIDSANGFYLNGNLIGDTRKELIGS